MHKKLAFLVFFYSVVLIAQEKKYSQTDFFDFTHAEARVKIFPINEQVAGNVSYEFNVLQAADTLRIDGRQMQFSDIFFNGDPVEFSVDETGVSIIHSFLPSSVNKLDLKFDAQPKGALYFINWSSPGIEKKDRQVWTQGQGKYTSNWLPSFDDMEEKLEFDVSYEFPSGYELTGNGILKNKEQLNDSVTLWQYDMKKPMSSYLVAFAAGKFDHKSLSSATGDSIILFFRPQDSLKVEPTYRYSKEIFDFLEKEIGEPYPWQNYKQIPVLDFLYAGMENTGTTIFSNSMMTDSIGFNDRNFVNVNAHELAHQWFGDLVTEKNGKHHWLNEGFATYYALLAEKELFGEDYFYWKLFETAEQLKELSDSGKGEAILSSNSGSLTYYQKGAWSLHILKEKIGEKAFKEGVKNYLNQYSFKNAETDNLIAEMEMASGQDLSQFVNDWLRQSAFKASEALESLKKSEFIRNYLNIAALRETPLSQKYELLNKALDFPVNDYIGQEVVHQLSGLNSELAMDLYSKAFESNNLYVRQAIALTMEDIPQEMKGKFESLLGDASYLTKEAALFKLWERFPNSRIKYFERTKGIDGFYNKNIRMVWLTLNLVTPEYEPEKAGDYYRELSGYTSSTMPFEVRENAFSYLYQIGTFDRSSLENLVKGTEHHTWRFKKYCRDLLLELLKNEEYRSKLEEIVQSMNKEETDYLRSKLTG